MPGRAGFTLSDSSFPNFFPVAQVFLDSCNVVWSLEIIPLEILLFSKMEVIIFEHASFSLHVFIWKIIYSILFH